MMLVTKLERGLRKRRDLMVHEKHRWTITLYTNQIRIRIKGLKKNQLQTTIWVWCIYLQYQHSRDHRFEASVTFKTNCQSVLGYAEKLCSKKKLFTCFLRVDRLPTKTLGANIQFLMKSIYQNCEFGGIRQCVQFRNITSFPSQLGLCPVCR